MKHVVLLGDSIFDNATYVPDNPCVIEQVKNCLPKDRATLLAIDGATTLDVISQLDRLPPDASHLLVSVGGNDALKYGLSLSQSMSSVEMLDRIASMKVDFQQDYKQMLTAVLSHGKPTVACTIYDSCPLLDPLMRRLAFTALPIFNDCIFRQAVQFNLSLIDLRLVCNEASDYSTISPIEPSVTGGQKIARIIAKIASEHDFLQSRIFI